MFLLKSPSILSKEILIKVQGIRICKNKAGSQQTTKMSASESIEIDLLDKKIRRLVAKLKKHNIDLEVFDHNDIEYGPIIGKGGEGVVQKCTVIYNHLPIAAAVKTIVDNSDDGISLTLDEIELLCLAYDPIVNATLQVYGVAAVPEPHNPELGHLVIITEAGLMNALQLYEEEEVPLHVTYAMWGKLAASVHMLHTKHIIHQDIKPENILITNVSRDSNNQIQRLDFKLIDMGMAKRVFTDRVVTDDILGTNGYHPPEVLFEDSYDFRADLFMLGITFCVLLLPRPTLEREVLQQFLEDIHTAKEQKLFGRDLYEDVIEPSIADHHIISTNVKNMLCNLLEEQERRTLTLLDIVELSRQEEGVVKEQVIFTPPVISPTLSCQDSGIGSEERSSIVSHTVTRMQLRRRPSDVSSCTPSVRSTASRVTRSTTARSSTRSIKSTTSTLHSETTNSKQRKGHKRTHSIEKLLEEAEELMLSSPKKPRRRIYAYNDSPRRHSHLLRDKPQ